MEYKVGPLFLRENAVLSPGEKVAQHGHNFDHVLFVLRGVGKVKCTWPDGKTSETTATFPWYGNIPAGVLHEIECIEGPLISWCVFPHRDFDGRVVERYAGNYAATM